MYTCLSSQKVPYIIIVLRSFTDSTAFSSAHFGQGSTIIIAMDDVGCTGSEATIFSCTHTTSHNCGHNEDAGVQCVTRECIPFFSSCVCVANREAFTA